MRFAGLFLLLVGFALTIVALPLLPDLTRRAVFIGCGLLVELFGLALLLRAQMERRR